MIGGAVWFSYHNRSKEIHTTKFDAWIKYTQIIVMIACVIFILFAVGHYGPNYGPISDDGGNSYTPY